MKQFSALSTFIYLTTALSILTTGTFAQHKTTVNSTSSTFDVREHINGNKLIQKMISEKREFNKNYKPESIVLTGLSAPQYILNRTKPTVITFDGLDYLIQNNCVLAVKGLDLSDEVLMQMTEKLAFLDKVQFGYAEKINLALNSCEGIRNMDKWYLLTLRILSTTVNDFATLAKKHDSASFAQNLVKMKIPNIDAIGIPSMSQSMVRLAK